MTPRQQQWHHLGGAYDLGGNILSKTAHAYYHRQWSVLRVRTDSFTYGDVN